MRSVMKHQFSEVPKASIPRSSFDRSHGYKTTFSSGYLVPVYVDEGLPGDTFSMNMNAFARMATPVFPFMDNLRLDTFFFAVPLRLLWDNWERFNGAQDNPDDSTDYLVPMMTAPAGGYDTESLSDYLGIPPGVAGLEHSALFHRAYALIWNEWFRDQNLQDSIVIPKGDGPDDPSIYELKKRGKRHDYFTSCLPWPQKGDSVDLPLGQFAPVRSDGTAMGFAGLSSGAEGFTIYDSGNIGIGGGESYQEGEALILGQNTFGSTGVIADLQQATAASINQLRQAFQIQKMLERDARGGTRYTEIIKAHFGVTSPDHRLQRPEFLGQGSTAININAVAQTSETQGPGTPQGNLAAIGTANLQRAGFQKSFTEHCIILGMVCVRADLTYQQGLNRMFSRATRYDFYWPALAQIGEQAVLNKEIYAQGTEDDEGVFGYQERFAEYRYKPSQITGKFRSDAPDSIDAWHLSQQFADLPVLSGQFIEENPPIGRVIALPEEPEFLLDTYFRLRCARPMPMYGVPGLIDHF